MNGFNSSVILLIGILLIAGCTGQSAPKTTPTPEPKTICTKVIEQIPIITEQCDNVSYTEEVCQLRELKYSVVGQTKTDLCIVSDSCAGSPLSSCRNCNRAMTRCTMTIKNLDPKETADWTVGANFTLPWAGFIKNPDSQTILPEHNATFDFYQIYSFSEVIIPASCDLYVINKPIINDCHQETRAKVVCANVTTTQSREKEVCSKS
ncbi:hypothetical protein HY988_07285 [Candidatus Micrarchaeota archaeon]|nr:hypothetical protein [Candidatus Micrarchaeota archaeon]